MERAKVLYVDDEVINLQIMKIVLKKYYEVITVDNGEDGLEILDREKDISIVISDMNMPKMNGIEFVKYAKTKYPNIGYYILTGYGINGEIENALGDGLILQYFKKPFDMKAIEEIISSNGLK